MSIRRAQGRLSHAAKIMALGTTAEVSGAAVGGVFWGLTGICGGWAITASCEAVFLLPAVLEVFRPTQGLILTSALIRTDVVLGSVRRRRPGQEPFVQVLDLPNDDRGGEGRCPIECALPHGRGGIAIVDDRRECSGKGDGVARIHEEPRDAILDEVDNATTCGSDDRAAEGHCLENHGGTAIGHDGWNGDYAGRLQEFDDRGVIEQPTQLHLIRKFERRVLELPSGQNESRNAAESSVRLEEHFNALVPA